MASCYPVVTKAAEIVESAYGTARRLLAPRLPQILFVTLDECAYRALSPAFWDVFCTIPFRLFESIRISCASLALPFSHLGMLDGSNRHEASIWPIGCVESTQPAHAATRELFLDWQRRTFGLHTRTKVLGHVAFFSSIALYRLHVRLHHLPTRLPNYRSFHHSSPLSAPLDDIQCQWAPFLQIRSLNVEEASTLVLIIARPSPQKNMSSIQSCSLSEAESVSAPCNHDHGVLNPTYYTHPFPLSVMSFPIANFVRANVSIGTLWIYIFQSILSTHG